MTSHVEQHTILFPVYIDKEAFQSMAEDEMLIRNHNLAGMC